MNTLFDMTEEIDTVEYTASSIEVKEGDLFQLGRHRLLCGDCTIKENIDLLMNGKKSDMVFTDPPYGISIVDKNGFVGGNKPFGQTKGKLYKCKKYKPIKNDDTTETAEKFYKLIKVGNKNIPFCTIRSKYGSYVNKTEYYKSKIGEIFDIVIKNN